MTGRVLGVDCGERRIGFALSDPDAIIASAYRVVELAQPNGAVNAIADVYASSHAARIVIGLPMNMNGTRGPAVVKVEEIAQQLRERLRCPVDLWDERLTTRAAHDILMEAGTRREKRRGLVDKVAAQLILQTYLDARSAQTPPEA